MARYKRYGPMLVIEPESKSVEEVSVRELSRDTSGVLARVLAGGRGSGHQAGRAGGGRP